MPILFERDDRLRRLTLIATSMVTGRELMDVLSRQATEGIWHYAVLYDSSAITEPPSAEDLRRVRDHAERLASLHGPRGPVAMFAPADAVYGTARIYEALSDERQVWRVFRTLSEAEAWLDATVSPTD